MSAHAHAASQADPIVVIQRQKEAENACVMDPRGKYPFRFGDEPVCDAPTSKPIDRGWLLPIWRIVRLLLAQGQGEQVRHL
ncbi:MAG: hypothetical protein WB715_03970 [Roseiarcus sp.]|uniref:hypothetical protein n=1 Tax=Roseiarcus sp. TaxID=1969460 RepID=UPI003C4B74FA